MRDHVMQKPVGKNISGILEELLGSSKDLWLGKDERSQEMWSGSNGELVCVVPYKWL
jgi:hypothetical protein